LRSIATDKRFFYLLARTKGLRWATKKIEFVICPVTGGNTITPPIAYSPTVLDVTGGTTMTLLADSLYV